MTSPQRPVLRRLAALASVLLALLLLQGCDGELESPIGESFRDDQCGFTFQVPSGWTVERVDKPDSFLRYVAVSGDGRQTLLVMGMMVGGEVDIEKLAGSDRELFQDLPPQVAVAEYPDIALVTPSRVIKTYEPRDQVSTRVSFEAAGRVAIVIHWQGPPRDGEQLDAISRSVETVWPGLERTLDTMGWGYIVMVFGGIGSCCGLFARGALQGALRDLGEKVLLGLALAAAAGAVYASIAYMTDWRFYFSLGTTAVGVLLGRAGLLITSDD